MFFACRSASYWLVTRPLQSSLSNKRIVLEILMDNLKIVIMPDYDTCVNDHLLWMAKVNLCWSLIVRFAQRKMFESVRYDVCSHLLSE